MGSTMRTLPVNVADRDRLLFCLDATVRNSGVYPGLASEPIENATPIRDFAAWQGKRNYEGLWWSSTTGGHLRFESLLEREYLLTADFDPDVVAIAAQPLAILWRREVLHHRSHVPDYFVRLSAGDGRVVDVRHRDRVAVSQQQFNLTRDLCGEIGWEYQVFMGAPPAAIGNLRWLAGYRHIRHAPSREVRDTVAGNFQQPLTLRAGIRRVRSCVTVEQDTLMSNIFHMLWCHELFVDLQRPLSMDTQVSV